MQMTDKEAIQFAFDWPAIPMLPLRCCTCGVYVREQHAIRHMNHNHPGWLEQWNEAIRDVN